MRIAPPGRTSSSQTGLVNHFGLHHCAMCFGSVQALNTSSRGASKMRVMTTSRLLDGSCDEIGVVSVLGFVWVIFLLLLLKFMEVILQTVHALFPQTAVLFQPTHNV